MKLFLLALFLAVATSNPIPDDSGPVDVIVNGVPEGEAVELGHIVDIKLQEHADGDVVATSNLLHPYSAVGIAEAASAAAAAQPELIDAPESVVLPLPDVPEAILTPVILPKPEIVLPESSVPESVILPAPAMPEFVPESVVLPSPAMPEVVPSPVVLPAPAAPEFVPESVVLPDPAAPVIIPEAFVPEVAMPEELEVEPIPVPAAQIPNGEIFNDGTVQVSVNSPEEPGILSTLQSWLNMAINYVNSSGAQTTQEII